MLFLESFFEMPEEEFFLLLISFCSYLDHSLTVLSLASTLFFSPLTFSLRPSVWCSTETGCINLWHVFCACAIGPVVRSFLPGYEKFPEFLTKFLCFQVIAFLVFLLVRFSIATGSVRWWCWQFFQRCFSIGFYQFASFGAISKFCIPVFFFIRHLLLTLTVLFYYS